MAGTLDKALEFESRQRDEVIGQRIAVVGATGSGKTTLSRQLAEKLGYRFVSLDTLNWESAGMQTPTVIFRQRIERALRGTQWVLDGDSGEAHDIIWGRADTIVWLDYATRVILWRLTHRALRTKGTADAEPGSSSGGGMQLRFWGRARALGWLFSKYGGWRQQRSVWLDLPQYRHLALVRLTSPEAARLWLARIIE